MKLHHHIGLSAGLAIALQVTFKSPPLTIASFLAGVLIDLDHVFDYLREYGLRPDITFFFQVFHKTLFRKIVLPLHSWELVGLLSIICVALDFEPLLAGIILGLGSHLLADQLTNKILPLGYFFFFRLSRDFVTSQIVPGKGI